MLKRHSLSLAIMLTSLSLVACNSNDDDNANLPSKAVTTTTITVTPSLGKILNGRIALKNATTGATLAATKTLTPSNDGTAKFTIPVSALAAPILAEVLPTVAGVLEYADEALEKTTTINVPVADINKPVLRAAASVTANGNIGVTALTEAAVQQAQTMVGGLVAQNINTANASVKNALNLNFNITQAPIVIGAGEFNKLVDVALDAQRRAYAAYLATLAKESKRINSTSLTPAYDISKALASDLSDGVFDAKKGTTLLSFYNNTFINSWVNWVQSFYTQFLGLNSLTAFNGWFTAFDVTKPTTTPTTATPLRTVDGIEEYACSAEGSLKSGSGTSIFVDFVNQRSASISTYWLNNSGARSGYSSVGGANGSPIAASGHFNQQTFTTHPWLITDSTGACLGIYKAVSTGNKTLTFKADGVVIGSGTIVEEVKTPATVNAGLVKNYALVYNQIQAGAGYTNGQKVTATVSSAGDLVINGFVLKNSYYDKINGADFTGEVIWKDVNIKYALSNNTTGVFNEINVFDTNKTNPFLGQFVLETPVVTNNCSSTGADDKLGFTNAPTDFCGFTKATSTAISNPDTYNFFNADKKENVEVTVVNNAVTSVSIENDKYGFACGVGEFTACSGVTLNTANTNTIEFVFNNTALSVANGASQGITVKNGSLIHQKSTGGSGSSSLAFNSAKCTQASSQTAFGMTAIAYNLCASDAVGDFSLTAQDNNTFSPTHDGIPCTITKVGSAVTLTKGAKSLTVQFNGDSTDVMTLRTGALTDAQVENDITARTAVGDPAGQTVRIEIRKNGTVASAQAQNIQGNESFGCVAL
jgi:hypothetical protein